MYGLLEGLQDLISKTVVNEQSIISIGSNYVDTANQSITVSSLNALRDSSIKALLWMVNQGIAKETQSVVRNPNGIITENAILIVPPTRDPIVLLAKRNGSNWIAQKVDPAYLRT